MRYIVVVVSVVAIGCDSSSTATNNKPSTSIKHSVDCQTVRNQDIDNEQQGDSIRKPIIPAPETIESMIVDAYANPLPFGDIPAFEVPQRLYDTLLRQFRETDAELDKSAVHEDQEMGSIRVRYIGGRSVRICWFWCGHKDRMSFSCSGIRYKMIGKRFADDETLAFDATIRRMYQEQEEMRKKQTRAE